MAVFGDGEEVEEVFSFCWPNPELDKSVVGKCNTDVVMFVGVFDEDFEFVVEEVVEPAVSDEFFVAK